MVFSRCIGSFRAQEAVGTYKKAQRFELSGNDLTFHEKRPVKLEEEATSTEQKDTGDNRSDGLIRRYDGVTRCER